MSDPAAIGEIIQNLLYDFIRYSANTRIWSYTYTDDKGYTHEKAFDPLEDEFELEYPPFWNPDIRGHVTCYITFKKEYNHPNYMKLIHIPVLDVLAFVYKTAKA